MKKKITTFQRWLAMVLCLSMAVSSSIIFCSAKESTKNRTPPPELIIGEGEVWVPDAVDPRSI